MRIKAFHRSDNFFTDDGDYDERDKTTIKPTQTNSIVIVVKRNEWFNYITMNDIGTYGIHAFKMLITK